MMTLRNWTARDFIVRIGTGAAAVVVGAVLLSL
jgi:hypothetical protein